MDNATSSVIFHFLPFSMHYGNRTLMFTIFFFIYLIGIIVNIIIIMAIWLDTHLHSPMYLFLVNLSFSDITYTTVVIPKLLYMTISGNYTVSFAQCLTQMYFYLVAATAEDIVLLIMAYDRYVAICQPLYYHHRLSKRICLLLIAVLWSGAFANSLLITQQILQLSFYHSVTVHHFFCDFNVLFHAGYGGSNTFYIMFIFTELSVFGGIPVSYNCVSYIKIIKGILLIRNMEGRRKAFSTSLPHLIVILLYYSSALADYLIPQLDHTRVLKEVLSMLYTSVIPILNPIIYSLRNNEIKKGLQRLVGRKVKH